MGSIRFGRWLPILLVGCISACTTAPIAPTSTEDTATPTQQLDSRLPAVTPEDLQFTETTSTAVISSAQKFILPVPVLADGGEPLIYPPDHPQAGQPILDWEGNPIGDRGIVFFNHADESVQAAPGDGSGVIIINEVSPDQAEMLHGYIASVTDDPTQLTLDQLQSILTYVQAELELGDRYNSTRTYIQENMVALVSGDGEPIGFARDDLYGFKTRNNQEVLRAVYIPEAFQFQGPAATPQMFDGGGVIVQEDDELRGIQPEVFVRTYTLSDGQTIVDLPQEVKIQTPF
jgi:hypothetical protein